MHIRTDLKAEINIVSMFIRDTGNRYECSECKRAEYMKQLHVPCYELQPSNLVFIRHKKVHGEFKAHFLPEDGSSRFL
jgi:hypothetical protein